MQGTVLGPGPHLQPPRTIGAVVRQARDALRRYRSDASAARQAPQKEQLYSHTTTPPPPQQPLLQPLPQPQQPSQWPAQQQGQQRAGLLQGCSRMLLQLPLPVASVAPPGVPVMEQQFCITDEGDWPGGIVQRFRALRPLVDAALEGYDPQFLGMLEDPADGMGCWSIGGDTTLVGLVTNATFANFAKLCEGGYGSRPLQPGHTLVAINPDWTAPEDIGQFWDRQLKASAQELLGTPWDVLYSCRLVRTSRGKGYGLLVGSYGAGWHLWLSDDDTSGGVQDKCLLWTVDKPVDNDIITVINKAAEQTGSGSKKGGLAALLDRLKRPEQ